jgi:hypothetical protein
MQEPLSPCRLYSNITGIPLLGKAAGRRLAEVGYSANVIASIIGHANLRGGSRQTAAADQVRMARQ